MNLEFLIIFLNGFNILDEISHTRNILALILLIFVLFLLKFYEIIFTKKIKNNVNVNEDYTSELKKIEQIDIDHEYKLAVIEKIKLAEVEDAISCMVKYFEGNQKNHNRSFYGELLVIQNRYNRLAKNRNMGTWSNSDIILEENRIITALVFITENIFTSKHLNE